MGEGWAVPIHTHAEITKEHRGTLENIWLSWPMHHSLVQKIRVAYPFTTSTMNKQSRFPVLTPNLNRDVRLELPILYQDTNFSHMAREVLWCFWSLEESIFLGLQKGKCGFKNCLLSIKTYWNRRIAWKVSLTYS